MSAPEPKYLAISDTEVVDTTTGEMREVEGCARCKAVAYEDVENLEKENRKLLRRIRKLESDREAERQADPKRKAILALIDRWKLATGHPKSKASADRFDAIKARLEEDYTVEQIELAIDGIGAYPFVVEGERKTRGFPGQKHDRLGIAMESGEKLEKFAGLGFQARKEGIARAYKPPLEAVA